MCDFADYAVLKCAQPRGGKITAILLARENKTKKNLELTSKITSHVVSKSSHADGFNFCA